MSHGRSMTSQGSLSPGPRTASVRLAAIMEDLRLPLDEGIKKTCFSLVSSLQHKALEVSTFTWYGSSLPGNVFPLPHNKLLIGPSFARMLRTQAPDVILYMPASSGTVGAFARAAAIKAQAPGIPLALLSLQYRELPAYASHLGLHRIVDVVFAQSRASAEVFSCLGCKTVVLSGGVDQSVFRPANQEEKRLLREAYGFEASDRIILHVGHCNRDRGVITLARLAGAGFKVILVASTSTAVDPDLLLELRQAGATVVTEFVENVQYYYQLADCYLFPVLNPTSAIDAPLSVLEAMACNLPTVTTPFGALPRMFEPGGGLYFGDTEQALVELVQLALEEHDCRTLEKVSPYSWDRAASTILSTLTEQYAL